MRFPTALLRDARTTALQLGIGRALAGAAMAAAPVPSARTLGVDTATARRVAWLTRMMAVRDGVLGLGTCAAARRGDPRGWLLAGSAADAVDAIVLSQALAAGRVSGLPARAVVAVAGVSAGLGVSAAVRST